jgi:hypothetical protein
VSKPSGGLYLWRTRKPTSFLGLSLKWMLAGAALVGGGLLLAGQGWWSALALLLILFSGRHNAYAGLTNSFYFREQQHIAGSSKWNAAAKPWSDLDPKCYTIPLPNFITHRGGLARALRLKGRWTLEGLETLLIWATFPVYNVQKQPPYNTRRISPREADRQRYARIKRGTKVNIGRVLARYALALVVISGAVWAAWEQWVA